MVFLWCIYCVILECLFYGIYLFIYLFIYLSIYLFIYLFIYFIFMYVYADFKTFISIIFKYQSALTLNRGYKNLPDASVLLRRSHVHMLLVDFN